MQPLLILSLSIAFTQGLLSTQVHWMERLSAREKEIQDVRFTYTQSVEILPTQESRISRGRVIFQKPNRFRMERETENEIIVSDGKTVLIYQKSRGLCLKKRARDFEAEALFPLEALFGGIAALQARFEVHLSSPSAKSATLEIRPRHTDGGQARKQARWNMKVFLEKDALPRGFELQTQAVRTRTTLSQIALNRLPSEKEFRLSLPKNVEIFEE